VASSVASTSRSSLFEVNTSKPFSTTSYRKEGEAEQTTPSFNLRLTPVAARDIDSVQSWLRAAFPTLPFPDNVALQMITHESWDHGEAAGHNRRLAFLGRRAMKFYLNLFLAQRTNGGALHTSERVDELLQTSMLGDKVGRVLNLAEVMRWTPAVSDGQMGAKETGLFKIRGVTVEALIGAIYHQHGAQAARTFFLTRVLPNLTTFNENETEALKGAIEDEARQAELGAGEVGAGKTTNASTSAFSTTPFPPVHSLDSTKTSATAQSHSTTSSSTIRSTPRQARRRSGSPLGPTVALDEHDNATSSARAGI
jgi:dsRNA-specific ribonuclease